MKATDSEPRKDAVIVLGMHRSGTSAMARILSLCGASLPASLLGANPTNPNGHWEPADIMVFNDQILASLDSGWNDMFGPRRNSQGKLPTQGHLDQAAELIRLNWGDSPFIVFKEPRVALLLDLWVEALKREGYRISFVIMVRHPLEIADSLKTRDNMSRNQALILWASYLTFAETGTRDAPRIFVKFSDLLENPERVVDRAETELKLVFPRRSWAATNEIERFLKSEDRHHVFTGEAGGGALATLGPLEKYYQYLAGAASGAAWNEDVSTELQAWLSSLEHTIGPVLKRLEVDLRKARAATENERQAVESVRAELASSLNARAESETELRAQLTVLEASTEAFRNQAAGIGAKLAAVEAEWEVQRAAFDEERTQSVALLNNEVERAGAIDVAFANARTEAAAQEARLNAEIAEAQNRAGASEVVLRAAEATFAQQCSKFEALRAQDAVELETLNEQSIQLRHALAQAIASQSIIEHHATKVLLVELARRIRLPFHTHRQKK